jgi:hypothetical protein
VIGTCEEGTKEAEAHSCSLWNKSMKVEARHGWSYNPRGAKVRLLAAETGTGGGLEARMIPAV